MKGIWLFAPKRYRAGNCIKCKTRIFAHGCTQHWEEIHFEVRAPVVNQLSVIFALNMSEDLILYTHSIDFVVAFPQAKVKKDGLMKAPWDYEVKNEDHSNARCSKLLTNQHDLKDGGLNWFDCLKSGIID